MATTTLPPSVETLREQLDDAAKHIGEQRGYIQKLEEALGFYAREWKPKISKPAHRAAAGGVTYHPTEALLDDCGNVAVEALEARPAKQSQSIAGELVEVGEGAS